MYVHDFDRGRYIDVPIYGPEHDGSTRIANEATTHSEYLAENNASAIVAGTLPSHIAQKYRMNDYLYLLHLSLGCSPMISLVGGLHATCL